jgi:ferredoxin-thioredoxin reductase catalytic subunit
MYKYVKIIIDKILKIIYNNLIGGVFMAVKLNDDKTVVERIKKGLKEKDGFCPCKLGKLPENKCMCEEFKAQIQDPDFEGYCHCMLYYKSK